MSQQSESPVGVGAPNRTIFVELNDSAVNHSVVLAGMKSKRHACYQGMLEAYCSNVLQVPADARQREFVGAALVVGQLVVAEELEDNWARWWLECTAIAGEVVFFPHIIDSAFEAARRDFEKHFGAGVSHG